MGLYRWNSGGQYRGMLWEQDLLADSQVCKDVSALCVARGKRGKTSNRKKAREK